MEKPPTPESNESRALLRLILPAVFGVLLVAGYLVLSQPGLGVLPSAQAQVNVQRIGESVAETVTEEGSKTSLDVAAEQTGEEGEATEEEEEVQPGVEPIEFEEGELPPGETAELGGGEEEAFPLPSISTEGVGGTPIADLSPDEMREMLEELPETGGSKRVIDALMPILRRFQVMVSPPWSSPREFGAERKPWEADSRRYSPFDPVGQRTPGARARVEAIPPFPGFGGEERPGEKEHPTVEQFVRTLSLRGVVGEPGNYRAIISGQGQERQFGVGEEIATVGDSVFVVKEITMNGVRIENAAFSGEEALLQFVERTGIADVSISY